MKLTQSQRRNYRRRNLWAALALNEVWGQPLTRRHINTLRRLDRLVRAVARIRFQHKLNRRKHEKT